jgi:hypothetical protein
VAGDVLGVTRVVVVGAVLVLVVLELVVLELVVTVLFVIVDGADVVETATSALRASTSAESPPTT